VSRPREAALRIGVSKRVVLGALAAAAGSIVVGGGVGGALAAGAAVGGFVALERARSARADLTRGWRTER
jgi:hypothetical protein